MDELAGFIGWMLSSFHDWLVPHGRVSWRRAVALVLALCLVSAVLLHLALPDGLVS